MKYPFSVCMSVYKNDKPADLIVALDSVVQQSVCPSEIVLVVDGPIPDDLNTIINDFEGRYGNLFKIIRLPQNGGLGNALRLAVENAKYDLIARMDSDDISMPSRFE